MSRLNNIAGRMEKLLDQASEACRLVGEIVLGIIVLLIVADVFSVNKPDSLSFLPIFIISIKRGEFVSSLDT